jgi:hypothetical protein
MSENGFEDKLSAILSNPEALAGIMNIAKGLGQQQSAAKESPKPQIIESSNQTVPAISQGNFGFQSGQSFKGLELLLAIKPFLDRERADRLDKITQILRIISYTDLFK